MKGGDDISEDLYKSSISVAKTGDTRDPIHPPSLRSNTCWYGMICRSTITWGNGYRCSILSLLLLRTAAEKCVHTDEIIILSLFNSHSIAEAAVSLEFISQSWSKTSLCSCTLSSSRINTHFSPSAWFFSVRIVEKSGKKTCSVQIYFIDVYTRSFKITSCGSYLYILMRLLGNLGGKDPRVYVLRLHIKLFCHQAARFFWCI